MNDMGLEPRERKIETAQGCLGTERWEWNDKTQAKDRYIELWTPDKPADDDTIRTRRARSRATQ